MLRVWILFFDSYVYLHMVYSTKLSRRRRWWWWWWRSRSVCKALLKWFPRVHTLDENQLLFDAETWSKYMKQAQLYGTRVHKAPPAPEMKHSVLRCSQDLRRNHSILLDTAWFLRNSICTANGQKDSEPMGVLGYPHIPRTGPIFKFSRSRTSAEDTLESWSIWALFGTRRRVAFSTVMQSFDYQGYKHIRYQPSNTYNFTSRCSGVHLNYMSSETTRNLGIFEQCANGAKRLTQQ